MSNPIITFKIEDFGNIKVELYPEIAKNTVNNFLALAGEGFYNGKIFHRVIRDFMIQGGCPNGNGMGGPGYNIKGEFRMNGVANDIVHTKGVISMARSGHPDSAGSQFFIMHEDAPHLDGQYAAFGQTIEGLDVVDKITCEKTGFSDKPKMDIVISEITIDLNGYEPEEVEKID